MSQYTIDNVRSSVYDGLTGFELLDNNSFTLKPNGKIFYGGFNIIDEENGFFTLLDQDYNESWTIEAKTIRSMKLKLNKIVLESKNSNANYLRNSFKNAFIVTRSKWNEKIKQRDEKIKGATI